MSEGASISASSRSSDRSIDYETPVPIMDDLEVEQSTPAMERHYLMPSTDATHNAGTKEQPRMVAASHACSVCAAKNMLKDVVPPRRATSPTERKAYWAARRQQLTTYVCSHPRCNRDGHVYVHIQCNEDHERMIARGEEPRLVKRKRETE